MFSKIYTTPTEPERNWVMTHKKTSSRINISLQFCILPVEPGHSNKAVIAQKRGTWDDLGWTSWCHRSTALSLGYHSAHQLSVTSYSLWKSWGCIHSYCTHSGDTFPLYTIRAARRLMKLLLGPLNHSVSLQVLTLCGMWSFIKMPPLPELVKPLVTPWRILAFLGSSVAKPALVALIYLIPWFVPCSLHSCSSIIISSPAMPLSP